MEIFLCKISQYNEKTEQVKMVETQDTIEQMQQGQDATNG